MPRPVPAVLCRALTVVVVVLATLAAPVVAPGSGPAPGTTSYAAADRDAVATAEVTSPALERRMLRAPRADRATRATRPPRRRVETCSGTPAERGQRVVASLRPAWRQTRVPVTFRGPRPGTLGEVLLHTGAVTIFVRPCSAESDELLRHVVAHELGHAWDVTRMTRRQRLAYKRFRGIPASTPWFGCSGCADFGTPAGDFAETYAQWLRQARDSRSELARPATERELAALARLFFGG